MLDEEAEELELVTDDEDVELVRGEVIAELELEGKEDVVELKKMVEVLNEVMDGTVLEHVVLELLISAAEGAIVLAVILALIDTEPDAALVDIKLVVVIGRIYPATLVLRRLAVLTKD
jgi:hypothetical protein